MFNPFDEGAEEYDAWFSENQNLLMSEKEAVLSLREGSHPSCEIGAGTGVFSQALGVDLGIEPSEDMAAIAEKRGVRIVRGRAEDIPLPDASQAEVFMITVECFLPDCRAAFREIRRILRDGGSFVIAFLNKDTEPGRIYDETKDLDRNYRYAEFHTADEILAMLMEAGFSLTGSCQTVFTLENVFQKPLPGYGEGLFTVFRCAAV